MKETLVLRDEHDQTLTCTILKEIILDDITYAWVTPVDQPVQVLIWDEMADEDVDPDSEELEGILIEPDPEDLDAAYPTAQAVLQELNLTLQRSAYGTLTVIGDLPEPEEEDIFEIPEGEEDEEELEKYQLLATFFHDERQFGVFTSLEPLEFFVVCPANADPAPFTPESPEDLDRLERLDHLLDLEDLED